MSVKGLKRLSPLAIILIMCMLMGVCTPVMAATYVAPTSAALFVAPSGQAASVPVSLMDGEDGSEAAVSGVGLTLSDNTAGVYKSGSNLILDSDLTKAGSVTVNAVVSGNSVAATMQVSPYVLFEDFDDGTVGANVTATKIEKLSAAAEDKSMFAEVSATNTETAVIAQQTDGNKYAEGDGSASPYKVINIPLTDLSAASNSKVTISAKILRNNGDTAAAYPGIQVYNSDGTTLINFRFLKATTTSDVYTKVSNTGTSVSSNGTRVGAVTTNAWINIRLELDLVSGTYDAYIGDITLTGYKMLNSPTNVSLGSVQLGVRTDDIAVYSGIPYTNTNTVTGTKKVLAPAADKFAKIVGYGVADASSVAVENVILSLADSYEGMQIRNNSLLVSNNVTAGDKYLVATDANGDFLAKGVVNVASDIYYEDFEDAQAAAGVTTAKLSKLDGTASDASIANQASTAVIANADGRGNYADCADTAADATMLVDLTTSTADSKNVVITAKIRPDAAAGGRIWMCEPGVADVTKTIFAIRSRAGKAGMFSYMDASGTYNSTANPAINLSAHKNDGTWVDFRVELDFTAKTYSMYIGEQCAMDNWAMPCEPDAAKRVVHFGMDVDDITVYSGSEIYITADEAHLSIPASGEASRIITAKYNDGTAVSNLTCTTTAAGVTAEGNQLKVSSSASVAPVTVTLSDGFVTGAATLQVDKNYILVNGTEHGDGVVLNKGESNTIYAAYGASDMKTGNYIIIARYSSDGMLKQLEKVVMSEETGTDLTAELTEVFNSGDTAKVFVWSVDSLQPVDVSTEIN